MYFPSPEAMDVALVMLDELLQFVRDSPLGLDAWNTDGLVGIQAFGVLQGYGSASICDFLRREDPNVSDDELFREVVNAWRKYLSVGVGILDEDLMSDEAD